MNQLLVYPLSRLSSHLTTLHIDITPLRCLVTLSQCWLVKSLILALFHVTYFQLFRFFSPAIRNDRRRLSWVLTWVSTCIISVLAVFTFYAHMRTVLHDPIPYDLYDRVHPASGLVYQRYDIPFRPMTTYPGSPLVLSTFSSAPPYHQLRPESEEAVNMSEICLGWHISSGPDVALESGNSSSKGGIDDDNDEDEEKEEGRGRCSQEQYRRDMIAFYHWVDKTFYGPADTSSSLLTRTMAQVTQDDKPVPSEPSLSSSSSPSSAYPPGSFAEFFGWFRLPPRIFFDLSYAKGSTVFTEWAVLFFGSYLVMDITIGYCYYRERITFISGYFHHALHLYMCYMALSHEVATYLSHFMNVEIATAVLATGFLFPGRRNDKLFGLMFIICRILIDLPFTHEVVRNTSMTMPCKILTLIKIPMNFKLFANWVKQQQKLRKQSQDALRKAQQMKKE